MTNDSLPGNGLTLSNHVSDELAPVQSTLVPVDEDGTFLVVGDIDALQDLDVLPLSYLSKSQLDVMGDAIARTAGLANVGVQLAGGLSQSAGLVRLAPETLALLRNGSQPLTAGGWNLGTLASKGKIVAQVRWAPATAASAVGVLAALGPAVAVAAVQWQLSKIGKSVERNIALTRTVLDEIRADHWYELHAAVSLVVDEARHVQELGVVSDLVWDYVQSQSSLSTLQKYRAHYLDELLRRRDELAAANDRSSEWFKETFADLLRDAQGAIVAQQGIEIHHLLRAAYARRSVAEEDRALAARIIDDAKLKHDECHGLVRRTLDDLYRSLSLWYEAEPGATRTVGGRRRVPLRDIRDAVANLRNRATESPLSTSQTLAVDPPPTVVTHRIAVPEGDLPRINGRLRWLLEDGESVDLVAYGTFKFGTSSDYGMFVVTDQRAMLVSRVKLMNGERRVLELPIDLQVTKNPTAEGERLAVDGGGVLGTLQVKQREAYGVADALEALKVRAERQQASSR